MLTPALTARASALIARYASLGLKIATAESCTGGLVAALLTEIPGSSAVVERGFVTYSNDAKRELLGVPAATVEAHGAVSEATARAMARAPSPTRTRKSRSASPASPGRTGEAREAGRPRAFRMCGAGRGDRGDRAPVSAISAGSRYAWPRSSRRWNCWNGLVARVVEGAFPSPREEARRGEDGAHIQRRSLLILLSYEATQDIDFLHFLFRALTDIDENSKTYEAL